MKILYDYQIFESQDFGGISRYFYELMCQFQNNSNIKWKLSIKYSDNQYIRKMPLMGNKIESKPLSYYKIIFRKLEFKGKTIFRKLKNKLFPGNKFHSVNQNMSISQICKADFDIFHPTYYDTYFLKYIENKPFVITVFDMIHEIYPKQFSEKDFVSSWKKILVQKANKIIAISENTKNDLVKIFGVNKNKISVIYLANSLNIEEQNPNNINICFEIPKKYILFVGTRTGYKNFYFFVRSVADLLLNDSELKLICTGNSFSTEEIKFFKNLGIKDKVLHFFASDTFLAHLYKNASVFIFPSLYEGFGVPVLEAFSCGCPVILSHISSLPEVGGDAVVYIDPKNTSSIQEAVSNVINNEKMRSELIKKGYKQVKKFSWEKMARETEQVYNEILGL